MTNAQRTWNVGETVEGDDYKHMPAGVFVSELIDEFSSWVASVAAGVFESQRGAKIVSGGLWGKRTIIARPKDAPAHIPVYVEPITYKPDVRVLNVRFGTEEQIRMLDKIKQEANALIAERDALKHALRKAQDACQRLREERDAAKIELQTQKAVARRVNNMMKIDIDLPAAQEAAKEVYAQWRKSHAAFTPALGASPKTREDFAVCPVGTQIRFTSKANVDEKDVHWEKEADDKWQSFAFGRKSFKTDNIQALVGDGLIGGFTARIISIPLARKPSGGFQAVVDNLIAAKAAPAVIRKGQKIGTPAQYDALPPGSRVRKADGQFWWKDAEGKWVFYGGGSMDTMRDLSFPRTVLRIGCDDTAVSFDVAGVPLKQDKPALRVGDMCSGKGYADLPVGSLVAYSGNRDTGPEESWHKVGVDSWRDVSGRLSIDLCSDARMAMERTPRKIKRIGPEPARFHVGQVISTREEYEALPVGATMQTLIRDSAYRKDNDGFALTMEYGRPPREEARPATPSAMDGVARIIRSLP